MVNWTRRPSFGGTSSSVRISRTFDIDWRKADWSWVMRENEAITSSAVKGEPSWNFTSFLRLKRQVSGPVEAQEVADLGISLHKQGKGYALHLVNYRLNSGTRQIEPIPRAEFKLGWQPKKVAAPSNIAATVVTT